MFRTVQASKQNKNEVLIYVLRYKMHYFLQLELVPDRFEQRRFPVFTRLTIT